MRTSILGIHEFWDLKKVTANAIEVCSTTHCDPRYWVILSSRKHFPSQVKFVAVLLYLLDFLIFN